MPTPNVGTPDITTTGGTARTAVASGATAQIKAAPGRVHRIILTAVAGAGAITAYDNAAGDNSGTVLAYVPASAAPAAYDFQSPATNGITVISGASAPNCTVTWS